MNARRHAAARTHRIPATPEEMLGAYVRAFEACRTEEVADYYLLPCTFIRPDGVWIVQDMPTALVLVGHLLEHARAQGHARTEISGLAVRPLGATLAMLSGTFVRFDSRRAECGRFGFAYIVRAEGSRWRIVVAVAHEPTVLEDRSPKQARTRSRRALVSPRGGEAATPPLGRWSRGQP
ncbi:MAG: hypothetical protein U0529_03475 [Thermoanaerobaculia bacterium]